LEQKEQDVVMHTSTMKEMWECLEEIFKIEQSQQSVWCGTRAAL